MSAGNTSAVRATVVRKEQPDSLHEVLLRWRRQRHRLQANLHTTVHRSLETMSDRQLSRQLDLLCNALVDYLATSHGSVYTHYRRLHACREPAADYAAQALTVAERERLLQDIWLHLGYTTDAALRFNRRCETMDSRELQQKLHAELGKLGNILSLRFALEEQLLALDATSSLSG